MPATLKSNLVRSLLLALASSLFVYALLWGLVATHPELGIPSRADIETALWTFPLVLCGSLLVFAAKMTGARRH